MRKTLLALTTLISVTAFPGSAGAKPQQLLAQEWKCTGIVRSIDVYFLADNDTQRRVVTTFADGSANDEILPFVKDGATTIYTVDPDRRGLMKVTGVNYMEFWEEGERIPDDVYTKCKPL